MSEASSAAAIGRARGTPFGAAQPRRRRPECGGTGPDRRRLQTAVRR